MIGSKWEMIDEFNGKGLPAWASNRFDNKLNNMKRNKSVKMVFKGNKFMYKAEFRADNSSGSYWYYKKRRNSK